MMKRPRIIISKERQSLDNPIRLPPMKANKLFMSMAFLLENTDKHLCSKSVLKCHILSLWIPSIHYRRVQESLNLSSRWLTWTQTLLSVNEPYNYGQHTNYYWYCKCWSNTTLLQPGIMTLRWNIWYIWTLKTLFSIGNWNCFSLAWMWATHGEPVIF